MFALAKQLWTRSSLLALSVLVLLMGIVYSPLSGVLAQDSTQSKLEGQINSLNEQIESTRIQLDGVRSERLTLEQTLNALRAEVAALQAQVAATQQKIVAIQASIVETQTELDRQKGILSATFRQLYLRSSASPLELIVASDSFSQYLDTQEYLERLKNGIADSVTKIQELKAKLQAEEAEANRLLSEQEGQKVAVQAVQYEQQRILDSTKGQEAAFQAQLDALEAEQEAKEKELDDYLRSLIASSVSLGPVSAGQVIGKLGNTGWSTGPHVHFKTYNSSGSSTNPISTMSQNGWLWPVINNGGWLSQGYHSGHTAIDIAGTEGTPLIATASGQIIHRGCLYLGTNYATFGVIIDHGGSYSLYIHMQAPNNPAFANCSQNRRVGSAYYGTYSIDYSTTN